MFNSLKENLNKITSPVILKSFLATAIIAALGFMVASFLIDGSAAKVNGSSVSLKDFNRQIEAQLKYQRDYQKINFSGEEGEKKLKELKKQVLDQLIEEEVMVQEAEKLGIKISQQDIDQEYEDTAKSNGGEAKLNELISNYYGFSKDEFKKYNLEPKILREKLQEKILSSDEISKEAKTRAEDILKQLKAGANFQELAKKYNEDQTSIQNSGDLGWIEKGKMVKEFEDKAFSLKAGEISDVFKTIYGYHIIKVEGKKDSKVHIYQILVKTKSFTEWLDEKVKSAKIKIYVQI